MNLDGFSQGQKEALLDLLVLGMYADGHLATVEDECVQELLKAMEFTSDYARDQFADACFTRVRHKAGSPEKMEAQVRELAKCFSGREDRYQALLALDELLASDDRVTGAEGKFLALVKAVFQDAGGSHSP
jgi:hypothetical protein